MKPVIDLAGPDRDLPQQQRHARRRLQHRQRLAHALVGLVDLVEEQEARDLELFELAQDQLQLRDLLLVDLADDDGGIDRRQHRAHVVDELDRARTIDEGVGVAHETSWWRPRARRSCDDGAPPCWRRRPWCPPRPCPGAGSAPVRARIASSSVVLPLWNGPTSAIHRGPVRSCAVLCHIRLPATEMWPSGGPDSHRFKPGGDWQEAGVQLPRRERRAVRMPSTDNGRPKAPMEAIWRGPPNGTGCRRRSAMPTAKLRPTWPLTDSRLQRDRPVRAADQDIGAEAGRDRHLGRRPDIVARRASGASAGRRRTRPRS